MRKKMFEDIKAMLEERAGDHVVKLTFSLKGREARTFLQLHQDLGGSTVIACTDLAARIVSHALERHEACRQERSDG
ncbi:MAG: hypothetical protein Q8L74_16830 [Nitrospirota bacterium]|nr:hypothetical protein [Nitrospirota bacterium]